MPEFDDPVERDEGSVDTAIARAEALLEMGRPGEGARLLEQALASEPEDGLGWCWLGLLLLRAERYNEAIAAAETAIAVDPEYEWGHRILGAAYWEIGDVPRAIARTRIALACAPESEALVDLAWYLIDQQEVGEATRLARRAVEVEPGSVRAWNALGRAARSAEKFGEAEASFRKALELDPLAAFVHNNLGLTLVAAGRHEEGLASFMDALRVDPEDPYARANAARTLIRLDRPEEAAALRQEALRHSLDEAEEAVRANPSAGWAYRRLARAKRNLGDADGAILAAERALELDRGTSQEGVSCRRLASLLLDVRDDRVRAWELTRRSLQLDGNSAPALCEAATVAIDTGRTRRAHQLLQRAAALEGNASLVHETRGHIALAEEDWSAALTAFRQAWEGRRRKDVACCAAGGYGLALAGLGELDGARRWFEKAEVEAWSHRCSEVERLRTLLAAADASQPA